MLPGGIVSRLTAKERIQLHLLGYTRFSESIEVPRAMTQDGLAAAADIELRHVSQYLRPLLRDGTVHERSAHVEGIRQRRKVYDLTEAGKVDAYRLRDRVKAQTVRVRDGGGEREVTFADAVAATKGRASLMELVRLSEEREVVDLTEPFPSAGAPARVRMTLEAPRVDGFVGRRTELEAVTSERASARIFVVRGVAGIGKSSFGAKACELLDARWNLFWHTVRPWDGRTSVLADLGEFLSALGKPGLRSVLGRGTPDEALDMLRQDLPGNPAFLILDDAHSASLDVLHLFRWLKNLVAQSSDLRLLFLTRRALPFYDRRDVVLHGLVQEIDLAGLGPEDAAALLGPVREAVPSSLVRRLGGHPLFLELARRAGLQEVRRDALRDVRRFIEEEIYSELTEPECIALKTASLYRVPVPRDALFSDSSVSHDILLGLSNRALVQPVGEDALQVHDTIRDFFAGILTPAERDALGRFARGELQTLAEQEREAGNLVGCVNFLSNALQLEADDEDRAALLERLGDATERLGDLPAALIAYKEATKLLRDPEPVARLHRKTASAFEVRGDVASASAEVEVGLRALGATLSIERGWLDLVRSGIHDRREEWDAARETAAASLSVFQSAGIPLGQARALFLLGNIEIEAPHGDPALAERRLGEALTLAVGLGDAEFISMVRTALAHLFAYRLGDADRALAQLQAIEDLPDAARDPHARRSLVMLKAWFNLELLGDCKTASAYFSEAIALARRIHSPSSAAFAEYGLACCAYIAGRFDEARIGFETFAEDAFRFDFPAYAAEAWWMVCETALRQGDLRAFRRAAGVLHSPRLAKGLEARPVQAKVLEGVERTIVGDAAGSRRSFEEALRVAGQGYAIEEASLVYFVHFAYGMSLRAFGEDREANEHVRAALERVDRYHLGARRAIAADAERDFVATLRKARAEVSLNGIRTSSNPPR